jgi:hypothetical protein
MQITYDFQHVEIRQLVIVQLIINAGKLANQ